MRQLRRRIQYGAKKLERIYRVGKAIAGDEGAAGPLLGQESVGMDICEFYDDAAHVHAGARDRISSENA